MWCDGRYWRRFCSRADLLLNGAAAVVEHANARTNSTRNLPRDRPEVLAQRREMRVADDELVARLTQLPEKSRTEAIDVAVKSTATMAWVPNPGPQTQAFLCEADELFYGGEAGGGKTDLGIGLALTAHKRSLLLRRINKDAVKIKPRIEEILGSDGGYNGQLQRWRLRERQIDIAGCEQESDKQRFKGDPHDLIVFDEGTDFSSLNIVSLLAGTARPIQTSGAACFSRAIHRQRQRAYGL